MGLEDCDILELEDRYNYIAKKYVDLAKELAPKLEEFGRYRDELQTIVLEYVNRNKQPPQTDSLEEEIKNEIERHQNDQDTDNGR